MPCRVLHNAIAAVPNDQGNAHRTDKVNEGKENRVVKDRIDVGTTMVVMSRIKFPQRLCLGIEDLHSLRARNVLLQKRINPRYARTNHVVTLSGAATKPCRGSKQHRNR